LLATGTEKERASSPGEWKEKEGTRFCKPFGFTSAVHQGERSLTSKSGKTEKKEKKKLRGTN